MAKARPSSPSPLLSFQGVSSCPVTGGRGVWALPAPAPPGVASLERLLCLPSPQGLD